MKKFGAAQKQILIILVFYLVLAVGLTVLLMPYFSSLKDPAVREKIADSIKSMGAGGILLMLGIQIVQVIIAFIPGEPIEVLCGVMYGGAAGLLLCLAGCVIASAAVFYLTRKFGTRLVSKIIDVNSLEESNFFNESTKLEAVTFVLFLIPGTPKDALTYAAAFSPIKLWRFLLISSLARIPSIVTSTYAGSALGRGNFFLSAALFIVIGIIGLAGILFKDEILNRLNKLKKTI